jgi:hypothetical protein
MKSYRPVEMLDSIVSFMPRNLTLKMGMSETLEFLCGTRRYDPEKRNLHGYDRKNLKPSIPQITS